jgi:hypothetical protein
VSSDMAPVHNPFTIRFSVLRCLTVLFMPSAVLQVVEFTFRDRFDPHYPPQFHPSQPTLPFLACTAVKINAWNKAGFVKSAMN